jgi:hypothetical protein
MMKRVHLSNTKKLFDFPDHFSEELDGMEAVGE